MKPPSQNPKIRNPKFQNLKTESPKDHNPQMQNSQNTKALNPKNPTRKSPTLKTQRIQSYLSQYIFFFFLASFFGWLWEVLIFLFRDGHFCNRGFLYGPWLPVYGIGATLLYFLLHPIRKKPVRVFFLALLIGSSLEFLIGWFLDSVWEMRYWDYSENFLNLHGYICLYSALGFGIAGVLWCCFLSDFSFYLYKKIPARFQHMIHTLLVLVFVTDCAASLIFPNRGRGVTF